jgi:hypothetical protein
MYNGNFLISVSHSYFVDKISLSNLFSLGYMFRHKCHHRAFIIYAETCSLVKKITKTNFVNEITD